MSGCDCGKRSNNLNHADTIWEEKSKQAEKV